MGENSSNSSGNFQARLLKPQSKCTEEHFEQKYIARRNIVSLICLGLRAKIICFDKISNTLLPKVRFTCTKHHFEIFVNILPLSHRFRDWRKKFLEYIANCLAQLLKLNSTPTEDISREIKLLTLFFIFRTSCVNFSEFGQPFRPSCQNPNLHVQRSIAERNKIFDEKILFHIIFGLRADFFSTFDKLFPELLQKLVFTSPAHQFDNFWNNSDSLFHFEI